MTTILISDIAFGPPKSQKPVYDFYHFAKDFLTELEATLRSASKSPIVVIAHNLGGIMAKEILSSDSHMEIWPTTTSSNDVRTHVRRRLLWYSSRRGGSSKPVKNDRREKCRSHWFYCEWARCSKSTALCRASEMTKGRVWAHGS